MPRGVRGGFPTYWTTFGHGPRAALMIHCSLGEAGIWGGVAQGLSDALTMTAFDLPGHGQSGDWDARGGMTQVCEGIAADFAAEAAPMDVIGHSYGAVVALALAIRHPDLVRSLVLIEPVFFAAGIRHDPAACEVHLHEMQGFGAALDAGDLAAAARSFIGQWGGGRPWDSFGAGAQARIARQMPLIEAAGPDLYDDALGMLDPDVLEAVAIPVLLLRGSASPRITAAINDALATRLPRARRTVIEGAGHMSVATHPGVVGVKAAEFLEGA